MSQLPRTVLILGLASLLTDLSSDMIYPLLPAFLALTLGAGAAGLGVMEGAAESLASLLKVLSGRLADRLPRRKPLVVLGYALSGTARPLIAFALTWPVVVGLRLCDRVGKGLRTAPRDALIADVTPESARGRAYGLHRAMDNAGATLGPGVAALLLWVGLGERGVFLAAAVPAAIVVVVLALGVREAPRTVPAPGPDALAPVSRPSLPGLGSGFVRFQVAAFVFALASSSDAFLLLRLSELGVSATGVAAIWAGHNAIRSLAVFHGGRLADRVDRRRLLAGGWLLFAIFYTGFALARSPVTVAMLLGAYALHHGAVEAAGRAFVADLAPPELRGSAFGWYHATVGFAALPASAVFGVIWSAAGAPVAFAAGAAVAVVGACVLALAVPSAPPRGS
jgi:MFS family permease